MTAPTNLQVHVTETSEVHTRCAQHAREPQGTCGAGPCVRYPQGAAWPAWLGNLKHSPNLCYYINDKFWFSVLKLCSNWKYICCTCSAPDFNNASYSFLSLWLATYGFFCFTKINNKKTGHTLRGQEPFMARDYPDKQGRFRHRTPQRFVLVSLF